MKIMRSALKFSFYIVFILALTGCASSLIKPQLDKTLAGQSLEHYAGPKAKIVITDFELKTAGATKEIGRDLSEIFINALNQSNRFIIVDQAGAELVVNVAVIEFNPEASGGKSGFAGGGSSGGSFMGGLLGPSLNKANMGLDLRIADKLNSAVISQKVIRAQALELLKDRDKDSPKWLVLKKSLSAYVDTPMSTVIHDCIIEGVRYLAQNVPLSYYKY